MREQVRSIARLIVAICITLAFLFLIYSLASADGGKEIYLVTSTCNDNGLELVFYVNSTLSPGILYYAHGNIEPENIGLGKWRYADFLPNGEYAIEFAHLENGQGILKNPIDKIICESKNTTEPTATFIGFFLAFIVFVFSLIIATYLARNKKSN